MNELEQSNMNNRVLVSVSENGIHGTPAYVTPVIICADESAAKRFEKKNPLRTGQYYQRRLVPSQV